MVLVCDVIVVRGKELICIYYIVKFGMVIYWNVMMVYIWGYIVFCFVVYYLMLIVVRVDLDGWFIFCVLDGFGVLCDCRGCYVGVCDCSNCDVF